MKENGKIEIQIFLNNKYPNNDCAKFFGRYIDYEMVDKATLRNMRAYIKKSLYKGIKRDAILKELYNEYGDSEISEYFEEEIENLEKSTQPKNNEER